MIQQATASPPLEALEETIEIRHGEDGTEIVIDNPTALEFGALAVVAITIILVFRSTLKHARRR